MTRRLASLALLAGACALPTPRPTTPTPLRDDAEVAEAPPVRVVPPPTGLEALRRELQPLRSVPEDPVSIPADARPYLRALRRGLRAWLIERVTQAGAVPTRVALRAELDAAELTASRVGEELAWGAVTRLDVLAPGEGTAAVVIGLRLACTSDDALYVFQGARLTLELSQDRWTELTDGRADLRALPARASRLEGTLLVSSLSQRCHSRWQRVRFEGVAPGADPERPLSRWDLQESVDTTGECGGFDEATLGMEASRNGFEVRGCAPTPEGRGRELRTRYRYTHDGVERVTPGAR